LNKLLHVAMSIMDADGMSQRSRNSGVEPAKDGVELAVQMENVPSKSVNGLEKHLSQVRTPEEAKAERRFVLKTDLTILPLLVSIYFLASLVSLPNDSVDSVNHGDVLTSSRIMVISATQP
jgi:hypothetical protein